MARNKFNAAASWFRMAGNGGGKEMEVLILVALWIKVREEDN